MLVSEANVCASAFVDGTIIEDMNWFVEERTFTTINEQLCEIGARKITTCESDVVLPPGANLVLVLRVSGTPSGRLSPTMLGSDGIRKWFSTRHPQLRVPDSVVRVWDQEIPITVELVSVLLPVVRYTSKFLCGDKPDNKERRWQAFAGPTSLLEINEAFKNGLSCQVALLAMRGHIYIDLTV